MASPEGIQQKLQAAGYRGVATLNNTIIFFGNRRVGTISASGRVSCREAYHKTRVQTAIA